MKEAPVIGARVVTKDIPVILLLRIDKIIKVDIQLKQSSRRCTLVAIKKPSPATMLMTQRLPPQRPGTTSMKFLRNKSPMTRPKSLGLKIGFVLSGVLRKCLDTIDIPAMAA